MAEISLPRPKPIPVSTATVRLIDFLIGDTFALMIKAVLIIYTVVLSHAAVTAHPIPAVNFVVMVGLSTVDLSLLTTMLRVKSGKIDSTWQKRSAILAVVVIGFCMAVNAVGGVAVIRDSTIRPVVLFVSYITPLLPVATLMILFAVDVTGNKVQAGIRAAIASNELAAAVRDETTQRQQFEAAKRLAQLAAEKVIADKNAELIATVATESLSVREAAMLAYVKGDEFRLNQERDAKRQTLELLRNATKLSTPNGDTPAKKR